MGQHGDDEYTLPVYIHHDAAKHGCNRLDAVNRTWIPLKKGRLTIPALRFIIYHSSEDASVYDATSKAAAAMVSKLKVHAAANVFELLVQTLVVLQTTPLEAPDVAVRSIKALRVACLSSQLLEIGEPAWRSILPS
ncbi:hypothetical protein TNCV_540621 [Trichonephila clavipes]|nr:hypothetical protein TNCV_540621 [Trichonephila clavipes]